MVIERMNKGTLRSGGSSFTPSLSNYGSKGVGHHRPEVRNHKLIKFGRGKMGAYVLTKWVVSLTP